MSRIGRKPVPVPANVKVSIVDQTIQVEGPKGKLSFSHRPEIDLKYDDAKRQVEVSRSDDERLSRSLHGLTRSLVPTWYRVSPPATPRKLEIVGVGYQAQLKKANTLALQVGYANQIVLEAPPGVTVTVPDPTHVTISGADKQAVGQFAAVVRKVRPPEPYKGKGIRYEGEAVRRKAGKAFGAEVITLTSAPGLRPGSVDQNRKLLFSRLLRIVPWTPPTITCSSKPAGMRRQHRVRKRLFGTPERPRLAVFRSSKHIYAQVINDQTRDHPGLGQHHGPRDQGPAEVRRQQGRRRGRRPGRRRARQEGRY